MRRFSGIKGKRPDRKEKKRREAEARMANSYTKNIGLSEVKIDLKTKVAVN
jgi:hypothetical protein